MWARFPSIFTVFVLAKEIQSLSLPRESPCNLSRSAYSYSYSSAGPTETPCLEDLVRIEEEPDDSRGLFYHYGDDSGFASNFTWAIGNNGTIDSTAFEDSRFENLKETKRSNRTEIPLCCPPRHRSVQKKCIEDNGTFEFPVFHDSKSRESTGQRVNEANFSFFVWDPCKNGLRYRLVPEDFDEDKYVLFDNGTIHQMASGRFYGSREYCLGIIEDRKYDVILCFEEDTYEEFFVKEEGIPVGLLISVPFLLATFVVYSLISDLKNMHGWTLRGYIGSLLVAYFLLAFIQMSPQDLISDSVCIGFAFTIHFSFLASFFWLNVMCFDIWWTFGGFRSLQANFKQRERKKFVIYSIYAWGCASILTGVCLIMDFVPGVPNHFIKPEFGVERCWFTTNAAKAIYFYGPMGVTVFCNICLFISTSIKFLRHKKDTAHHLKGTDSRRHDDNKQWFSLYLKLFIVMGINWSMEIVSWLCADSPAYIWYITDLTNALQGVIIFLIFVWKDKIKRLLLKKFGYHGRDIVSRNSTRSVYHSSAPRTCTTSAAPLQEKMNPYTNETSYRSRGDLVDSDCA